MADGRTFSKASAATQSSATRRMESACTSRRRAAPEVDKDAYEKAKRRLSNGQQQDMFDCAA